MIILLLGLLLLPVQAAGYSLQVNSPTAVEGTEFLLRLSLKDAAYYGAAAGSAALRLRYNPEELEFLGAESTLGTPETEQEDGELVLRCSGESAELKLRLLFRALKVAESPVELTAAEVYDGLGQRIDCRLSIGTVHIIQAGDDATLYQLSTVPGTFSPAFSPDVHSYTLTVPAGTQGVQVTARPNGYYATAFVEGHWGLHDGHNRITVDMTSAQGVSALYTIDVLRNAPPAPVVIPTAEPVPEASTPTPVPVIEVTPTPAPTPEPTPTPAAGEEAGSSEAPAPSDEETRQRLAALESELASARQETEQMARAAKRALVFAMSELVVIVILCVVFIRLLRIEREDDYEDDDEYEEESDTDE